MQQVTLTQFIAGQVTNSVLLYDKNRGFCLSFFKNIFGTSVRMHLCMCVCDWLHAFSTQFLKYINNTPIKITSLQNTRLVLFIVDCLVTPLPVAIGSPITPVETTDPYHPGRPLIFEC